MDHQAMINLQLQNYYTVEFFQLIQQHDLRHLKNCGLTIFWKDTQRKLEDGSGSAFKTDIVLKYELFS